MKDAHERRRRHTAEIESAGGSAERHKSTLGESEIRRFLAEKGVVPVLRFVEGGPLICVLPDVVRSDKGPYGSELPERRPCIARIDNPTKHDGANIYSAGQIDYFVIQNGTPVLVKTSHNPRPYLALKSELYEAADWLFPKSKNYENVDANARSK